MAEYIEREALKNKVEVFERINADSGFVITGEAIAKIGRMIDEAPAADVVPVKHGRWKLGRGGKGTCDQCNFTQLNVWDYDNWQRYCGCCGAKMEDAYSDG